MTTITPGLLRTGSHPNARVKGQHEKEYAAFATADANPLVSMDGGEAADAILDALRHGDAALTLTLPAKLAAAADGLAPGLVGGVMKVVAQMLPDAAGPEGDRAQTGWQSFSRLAPSLFTRPADVHVAPNNELRGHTPPA